MNTLKTLLLLYVHDFVLDYRNDHSPPKAKVINISVVRLSHYCRETARGVSSANPAFIIYYYQLLFHCFPPTSKQLELTNDSKVNLVIGNLLTINKIHAVWDKFAIMSVVLFDLPSVLSTALKEMIFNGIF